MHNETRFRKTSINPDTELEFDSNTLRMYLAIDENKTLIEMFSELRIEQEDFKVCMLTLFRFNLIEEIVESIDYVAPEFMDRVQELLIDISGPLGGLLIEEAAADMNITVDRIPKSKISILISSIASIIPGEKQAMEFKKVMLQELKDLIH